MDRRVEDGVDRRVEDGVDHRVEDGVDHRVEDGVDCQVEVGVAAAMCFLPLPHFLAGGPAPAFLSIFVMRTCLVTALFHCLLLTLPWGGPHIS